MLGVSNDTVVNWEKDKTKPVAAQFRLVVAFLGHDSTLEPRTFAERLGATTMLTATRPATGRRSRRGRRRAAHR